MKVVTLPDSVDFCTQAFCQDAKLGSGINRGSVDVSSFRKFKIWASLRFRIRKYFMD